jgi:uncharacterized membrane protein
MSPTDQNDETSNHHRGDDMSGISRGLRRTGTTLAALMLLAGAAMAPAAPAAAAPVDFANHLRNGLTGKCLGISAGSTANGANAMQWTCAGQLNSDQTWQFREVGSGYYRIRNSFTGKCLGIDRAGTANGALAIQANCSGTLNNQAWREEPLGNGRYQFRNFNSGRCLGINAGSTANGALAMQWDCAGQWNSDQAWIYVIVS